MNNSDSSGQGLIKNAVKWLTKNVAKPVVKALQNNLAKVNATYSTGNNITLSPSIWAFSGQYGISLDTKGNIAIQGSLNGGITTGTPTASITRYQTITNAPTIYKLNGSGYQIGCSVAAPVIFITAGAEGLLIPDQEYSSSYLGFTKSLGASTPGADFHIEWGETRTWKESRLNVFDLLRQGYIKIMDS